MSARPRETGEQRFIRRALAFRAALRDPATPGLAVMASLVIGGFGTIAYAWFGTARIVYAALQIPRVVSGGIGGLALIGVGVALFAVQVERRDAAREREANDDILDDVAELVALAPGLARIRRRRIGEREGS